MNALVAAARAYLGAPFQHMGRSRHGMDCAGLVVLALRDIGRQPQDVPSYTREPWKDGLRAAVEAYCGAPALAGPVTPADVLPGDVLLLRVALGGPESHLAIVTDHIGGGVGIIHSRSDVFRGAERGKVVEHTFAGAYPRLVTAVYR